MNLKVIIQVNDEVIYSHSTDYSNDVAEYRNKLNSAISYPIKHIPIHRIVEDVWIKYQKRKNKL